MWTEGREAGPSVIALGAALTLTAVAFDYLVVGHLSFFFDLCFVVVCLGLALVVAPGNFYAVGVLPPLLLLGLFLLIGAVEPGFIADPRDGLVQAVVSGLAHHSLALVSGYALCLATLGWRQRALSRVTPRNA